MGEKLQSRSSYLHSGIDELSDHDGQEIYRFDGSDEQLLEKIAEAYDEVRCLETGATITS